MHVTLPRLLIFTATYNEQENIVPLIDAIWKNAPHADILVTDDHSPDGTGESLEKLKLERNPGRTQGKLLVHHRSGKLGVGSAHREALEFALKQNYDYIITMDADFSHDPALIGPMLTALRSRDFVIGSRFIEGASLEYHGTRRLISVGANILARTMLGVPFRETTTSYRGFSKKLLQTFPIKNVKSEGYSFFLECSFYVGRTTRSVMEIPICFKDRKFGKSKISKNEILKGFLTLFKLFLLRVSKQLPPLPSTSQ